jgi:hypothetical protein
VTSKAVFTLGYDWARVTAFALADPVQGFYERFDGRALKDSWTPPVVRPADTTEDDARLADATPLGTVPLLSHRAVQALTALPIKAEFLPVVYPRASMFVLNVTAVEDCLAADAKVERFPTGRVMRVIRYEFEPSRIGALPVFRIPELLHAHLFVTQEFLDTVDHASLIGFGCEKVWASRD